MKVHWLQHVPFEGLGSIEGWAKSSGAEVSVTRLYSGDELPSPESFDLIIVMGGPMGIFEYEEHPWLHGEKGFIRKAIDADKNVLGICLGAQLIADVLGAKVYPGPQKEIGWFPIRRAPEAPEWLPAALTVFHWHGDTFEIPENAVPLATSKPGINQGFVYNDKVVALQFHMETTEQSMNALIKNCGHELVDAPAIQSAQQMHAAGSNIKTVNAVMKRLLDSLMF